MTPFEIGQIYDEGRDAIIGLFNGLLAAIAQLRRQNGQLLARAAQLEAQLFKDSRNSISRRKRRLEKACAQESAPKERQTFRRAFERRCAELIA